VTRPDLKLLEGAIDMHAHTAPALFPRPIYDTDLAKVALDYRMRGFVLKDHDSATFHRAFYLTRRVGRPLRAPFAGCWSGRRGSYRVRYRIDEERHTVVVLDIAGRADAYHRGRA
jgi:Family of unknown function (DUF6282)/ParE toxin of type II toxin-antitoxin system, parDE